MPQGRVSDLHCDNHLRQLHGLDSADAEGERRTLGPGLVGRSSAAPPWRLAAVLGLVYHVAVDLGPEEPGVGVPLHQAVDSLLGVVEAAVVWLQ